MRKSSYEAPVTEVMVMKIESGLLTAAATAPHSQNLGTNKRGEQ